jgi:hypothetical protein
VVDGGPVEAPDSNLRTVAVVREVLVVLLIVFVPFLTVSLLFLIVFVLLLSVLMLLLSVFMLLLVVLILFFCVYKAMPICSLEVDHDIVQPVSTYSIFISLSTP